MYRGGQQSGMDNVFIPFKQQREDDPSLGGHPTGGGASEDPAGTATGGAGQTGPVEPLPGEAPPAPTQPRPPRPPMPPAGGTAATPLGAGSFQLPGSAGAGAAFRTPNFLRNRFVGGRGVGPEAARIGSPSGETASITGGMGAQPDNPQLDPEMIRQIFMSILGGR